MTQARRKLSSWNEFKRCVSEFMGLRIDGRRKQVNRIPDASLLENRRHRQAQPWRPAGQTPLIPAEIGISFERKRSAASSGMRSTVRSTCARGAHGSPGFPSGTDLWCSCGNTSRNHPRRDDRQDASEHLTAALVTRPAKSSVIPNANEPAKPSARQNTLGRAGFRCARF